MSYHTTRHLASILIGFLTMWSFVPVASAANLTNLRCEYGTDPLGIDTPKPRLSWIIESPQRGDRQTAYRVLVASSQELLTQDQGDLWDSGKVTSDQSNQVEYGGKPLTSGARCHWKVRIWDRKGQASSWSQSARWTTGLLDPKDWHATWIKPGPAISTATGQAQSSAPPSSTPSANQENPPAYWVRKVFDLEGVPTRATAYVNVLGYYELYLNGQKVGDDVLSPAVSDHARRSFYRTYDLSGKLNKGRNCVGLWLADGWSRSGPSGRTQIDLSVGGKATSIVTDKTWTCTPSTHARIGHWTGEDMGGERIDARRDIPGWSTVDCAAGDWVAVQELTSPDIAVQSQPCPPNRIGQVIPLATCTELGPHLWELDFGTNLSGWLRLRLPQLQAGQRVVMHYADKRYQTVAGDDTPAGKIKNHVNTQRVFNTPRGPVSYQTFNQVDEFISAGKPNEQFCSKFNNHGFRYVIIEGLPTRPEPGAAEALLIESALDPVGAFTCSNDLFNRICAVNDWTLRCLNLGGYMIDCPHRERLGYGDGQVSIETQTMNRDTAGLYGKWAADWMDAQDASSGDLPHTAPNAVAGGGPAWGGVGCVLPWKLYLYYGDLRAMENSFEQIRRYSEFLESKCTDGILRWYGGQWNFIGDWVPPDRGMDTENWPSKPAAEFFNNCYRVYLWDQLARAADALGRTQDAQRCRAKASELRPLIHAAFYDKERKLYVVDEQCYYVMPLMTGVVPEELRQSILHRLEDNIRVKNKGHLDTGMLGTYFLIQYLQETARNDLINTIMSQTTYPGWGYMLSQGATTFWEQWNGYFSHIHSCFTNPGSWFYQGLAGIRPDETAGGFKKFVIRPAIVGDVTWVNAHYDSIHGRIVSNWKREADRFTLEITVPPNTTATVFLPSADAASVLESGTPAAGAEGVKLLRTEPDQAVFAVESGSYSFASTIRLPRTE